MKKAFILISAVLLAACSSSQNHNNHSDEVDWNKPQYSIDQNGDTIKKWVYNETGLLTEILSDIDENGNPGCVEEYTYDGNTVQITISCKPHYQEVITYADDSYTKILKNSGWVYEYDEDGTLVRKVLGTYEVTYDYFYNSDGTTEIHIGDMENHTKTLDSLDRLINESYLIRGLDIISTSYRYEGRVCYVKEENLFYARDEFGGIPDLDETFEETYEYMIFY